LFKAAERVRNDDETMKNKNHIMIHNSE